MEIKAHTKLGLLSLGLLIIIVGTFHFLHKDRYELYYVIDGDTIVVERLGSVRLAEIDAPELDNPRGYRAKEALEKVVDRCKFVYVRVIEQGYYGRDIARVRCNDIDLSDYMLHTNNAVIYE